MKTKKTKKKLSVYEEGSIAARKILEMIWTTEAKVSEVSANLFNILNRKRIHSVQFPEKKVSYTVREDESRVVRFDQLIVCKDGLWIVPEYSEHQAGEPSIKLCCVSKKDQILIIEAAYRELEEQRSLNESYMDLISEKKKKKVKV